ncbi:MAG: hypothetical protein IPF51_14805 [Dehalococcoidia bacterium]|uniref:hypothetical protein n=1 Tax=Candidatus Amarobacter glycogenicus TaxID=3140699 RepID=UPI003134E5CD|nr:hypothetical protein [Dehalococcoidia bacterium]
MRPHAGDIPLAQVATRRVRRPGFPWIFAMWMAVSAAISVCAGLVLGLLAALETGYGLDRWTQSVQAHGRLQLWAFAGVFIVALAFEFLVRMNGRQPFSLWLRIGVPAGLAGGGLLQAAGQLWYDQADFLGPFGGVVMLAASGAFAVAVVRVKPPHSLKLDPQPWFVWFAGGWLVTASAMALIASLNWEMGTALPAESHLVAEVFLRGFLLQVILAIGPRALGGHMGLPLIDARKQIFLLVTVNAGTALWVAGQDVWVLPGAFMLVRVADIALGVALLLLTYWLRIFSNLKRRYRGERYEWAAPIAWLGAVIYAATLVLVRLAPAGDELNLYQEGAIRHIFLLGFVLPLMLAMAHIVLARFGAGYIPWQNLLTAGFLLLVAAWPLRVIPALAGDAPGDAAQGAMALAGVLAMAALSLTAAVCIRTAIITGRPIQQIMRAMPG